MEKAGLELKFNDFQARGLFQCGCLDLDHTNVLLLSPNGETGTSRERHSFSAQTNVWMNISDINREVNTHRARWKTMDREAENWLKAQTHHLPFMGL